MQKTDSTKAIVRIGILAAIAVVLQYLGSFMGIKVGGFLDVELSDYPAILGALAIGPMAGVLIELIKNILHLAISHTGFIGELANFVINGVFVLVIGLVYKKYKTKKGAIGALLAGTIVMCIVGFFANVYVMLPFYAKFMPALEEMSVRLNMASTLITPFNFVKGIVLGLITLFSYKPLSPILHK